MNCDLAGQLTLYSFNGFFKIEFLKFFEITFRQEVDKAQLSNW